MGGGPAGGGEIGDCSGDGGRERMEERGMGGSPNPLKHSGDGEGTGEVLSALQTTILCVCTSLWVVNDSAAGPYKKS